MKTVDRVAVSVPVEIRERMKSFPDVNWSQLATVAFVREMNKLSFSEAPIVGDTLESRVSRIEQLLGISLPSTKE